MNRLVGLASVKGAPGVTSTALVLASTWPRPVVLVEADPSGGDLTYRCRAAHGGVMHHQRSILSLAAASAQGGARTTDLVLQHAQRLSCGVDVVAGCLTRSQSGGLKSLWSGIETVLREAPVDIVCDLGRIDPFGAAPLAETVDVLLLLGEPSLSSAAHLAEGVAALTICRSNAMSRAGVVPVLVGPDASAERDCSDVDEMLRGSALPPGRTMPIPIDRHALTRLESGERASGRLGRTLLLRRASQLARALAASDEAASA